MLRVHHRFEMLSEADSGKEHLFTWEKADGTTLLRTMYQSGGDTVPADDPQGTRVACKRGSVLRIQPDAHCTDFAPSHDAETGCIPLQIDDASWNAADYTQLAQRIRSDFGFSHSQQAAVFSQLASLYNLMATQYDKVFDLPLSKTDHASLNHLVTNPRRQALSDWFAQSAEALIDPKTHAPAPLSLPAPPSADAATLANAHFIHTIHAVAGKKQHRFEATGPANERLVNASYESGSWGETIWLTFPLPLAAEAGTAECPTITMPFHTRDFGKDTQPHVLDARTQLARMHYLEKNYQLSSEQVAAGMTLLASVYRLAATHYQAEFPPKTLDDAASLQSYIRNPHYQRESDSLLRAAYLEIHSRLDLNAPFRQHHQQRNLGDAPGIAGYAQARLNELERGLQEIPALQPNTHQLDLSFIPAKDNALCDGLCCPRPAARHAPGAIPCGLSPDRDLDIRPREIIAFFSP